MTEPHESKVARRREAKRLIDMLTTICVVVAIAIGTSQLVKEGLQEFLNRPPGVGASPSEADVGGNVAETPPPEIAQVIPPEPSPSPAPQPLQRHTYNRHGSEDRRHSDHAGQYR